MKTVLITGANRGLGKGFVKYFLSQNFIVFAGARNQSSFEASILVNKNLTPIQLDVSSDESIDNAVLLVKQKTDNLDYLINNAGNNSDSATNNNKKLVCKLKDLDRNLLLNMFNVNTISPILVVKAFLPLLKNNPSFVVNISSDRASYHDEYANSTANYGYRASKTALNMITHCSVFDLTKNIKTFAVHPGGVKSDMNPTGIDDPQKQAEKIIKITRNWKEEFNGKYLRYDGSLYPL